MVDSGNKVKTILIVEDDTDIGEFLIEAIKSEMGYQTLLAANAVQALERVHTLIPDVFLLDYHLPGINGLELADRLRKMDALKQIPIILMSANSPRSELEKHNISFLEKPFDLNTFLQTIEAALATEENAT